MPSTAGKSSILFKFQENVFPQRVGGDDDNNLKTRNDYNIVAVSCFVDRRLRGCLLDK